jgi:hypothetical protein
MLDSAATILSSVTALVAVLIAVIAERRATAVAEAQVFLTLRTRFLSLYERMGDVNQLATNDSEKAARFAYWHHSYDEWFITEHLAPRFFKPLWSRFFERAVSSGRKHQGLRAAFDELVERKEAGFADYAQDFISRVREP